MADYTARRFAQSAAETHCSMVARNMWTATTALIVGLKWIWRGEEND